MARLPRGQEVTVHLENGTSVRGLLVGRQGCGPYLRLRRGSIEADGNWVQADGDLYVPLAQVAVVQC
jgi:hypothetical protein